MDNNEDYVKQQINALIHVQDNLCPELFLPARNCARK